MCLTTYPAPLFRAVNQTVGDETLAEAPQTSEDGTAPEAAIEPDATETPTDATPASADDADPATGRTAREWQGEHDKVLARLKGFEDRLAKHGTWEQVDDAISQFVNLARRPDFEQFRDGTLLAPEAVDDLRTDEEKRQDDLPFGGL